MALGIGYTNPIYPNERIDERNPKITIIFFKIQYSGSYLCLKRYCTYFPPKTLYRFILGENG